MNTPEPIKTDARVMNLGCGKRLMNGACNVDLDPNCGADVVCDLDAMPWPFADNRFEEIHAFHVVEHLANPYRFLCEIHRVAKHGARLELETPHYSSPDSWNDISHKYHFGTRFLSSVLGNGLYELSNLKLSFGHGLPSLIGRFLAALFGPDVYEKYFCFMFPARNMRFTLKVRK